MPLKSEKSDMIQVCLGPALILEDDPALQLRLSYLLCQSGVAEADIYVAGSLTEATSILQSHTINFALIDIALPDGNGIEFIQRLKSEYPQIEGLIISAWGTEDLILAALRAGAIGYLLKEREDDELLSALRSIQRGGSPIDPFIARRILSHALNNTSPTSSSLTSETFAHSPLHDHSSLSQLDSPQNNSSQHDYSQHNNQSSRLSGRETEILQYVATGMSNREIADTLNLSRLTIECHIKNIYRKLEVASRTQAIHQARLRGLLSGLHV